MGWAMGNKQQNTLSMLLCLVKLHVQVSSVHFPQHEIDFLLASSRLPACFVDLFINLLIVLNVFCKLKYDLVKSMSCQSVNKI